MTRARLRGVTTVVLTACALLMSAIGACATDAAGTARTARTARSARSAERHGVTCQRKHGRTIFRHGIVRAFKSSGTVFGCVDGSTRASPLWGSTDAPYETVSGSILQVSGRFVAFETETGVKGSNDWSIEVADLRSGDGYGVAYWSQTVPFDEQPSPVTPPVQALVLGPDGRAACLEEVFDANVAPSASEPFPSRQVLVLLGFHHFHRRLAVSVPGGIVPGSVAYDGHTVTWTQNGAPQSASV
jgi:hypothetical protein